jgi:RNAse (barnase) inhibitor barstar
MTVSTNFPYQIFSLASTEQLPGVYFIGYETDRSTFLQDCIKKDLMVIELDGQKTQDEDTYFTELVKALDFPDYFGRNWDAVADCLTDLDWEKGDQIVVFHSAADRLSTDQPWVWQAMMSVWQRSVEYWSEAGVSLYLVLQIKRS